DHEVVADGNGVHQSSGRPEGLHYTYLIRWQSVSPGALASRAITSGMSSKALSPVISASSAGSASIDSASAMRSTTPLRARCDAATRPTWDEVIVSRCA